MPKALLLGLILAAALTARPSAVDSAVHGRLQWMGQTTSTRDDSLDALLGDQTRNDLLGDLRLGWAPRHGNWDFSIQGDLSADHGDSVEYTRKAASYFPPAPTATLWNLGGTLVDDHDSTVTTRIDRLAVGYSTPAFVVRLGRQALTWGAGYLFHPMDLIDPFPPNATDTEYKPGVDMLYGQWLFDDGSDLQAVAVPRPKVAGGPVEMDSSTAALQYRATFGEIGTTWLLTRDRAEWTLGLGLSGPLDGATWNIEVVPTRTGQGANKISALANISYGTAWLGRNITMFAEYFHNGFGVGGRQVSYDRLPTELTNRLASGQLFNTSRNYLAGGMTLEWTPLLTLSPSLIANLDDGSNYSSAELNWSVSEDTNLIVGMQVPIGPKGTEYGGRSLTAVGGTYIAPPTTAYATVRRHF